VNSVIGILHENVFLTLSGTLRITLQLMSIISPNSWMLFSLSSHTWMMFDLMGCMIVADTQRRDTTVRRLLRLLYAFFAFSASNLLIQSIELIVRCRAISNEEISLIDDALTTDRADSKVFFLSKDYIGIDNKLCPNIGDSNFIPVAIVQIVFIVCICVLMFLAVFPFSKSVIISIEPIQTEASLSFEVKQRTDRAFENLLRLSFLFLVYTIIKFACATSPIATLAVDNSISTAFYYLLIAFSTTWADRLSGTRITQWSVFVIALACLTSIWVFSSVVTSSSEMYTCGRISSSEVSLASSCVNDPVRNLRSCLESSNVLYESDASGFCPNIIFGASLGWIWMTNTLLTGIVLIYYDIEILRLVDAYTIINSHLKSH
jgi:hypothetical protein